MGVWHRLVNYMATAGTAKHSLLGTWRIVETELWDVDDLDLMEPAHLTLEPKGHGRLGLLAIEGDLDYRMVQREDPCAILNPTEIRWLDREVQHANRGLATRVGLLDGRSAS